MNVRMLCLALLERQPMSGYEVRKLIGDGILAHFAEASFGSIYPALDKLEVEGLVTGREERHPGKPPRRVFAITEAGRRAFIEGLHQMPDKDEYRSPFLLIAASARLVAREHIARVIDARLGWCRAEIARMEAELAACGGAHAAAWRWTLEYGLTMYRASLAWLEANRVALEAIAPPSFHENLESIPRAPSKTDAHIQFGNA